MSLEVRIVVVSLVVVLVLTAVGLARWWRSGRARAVSVPGLAPGLYLLTSADCDTCADARERLRQRQLRFTELTWQDDPEVFERLTIEVVPSLLAVNADGSGRWWPGSGPRRGP